VTKKKNYIDKRCTKMGGSKNAKEPNEKKGFSIIYQRTKIQKMGSLKNEGVEKKIVNYMKWKL
jgi:hypothetical protein